MAIDHVQMTLVHRYVDRFAYRAAGMVDRGRHVGQLHEVAEILDRCIAAAFVVVADERWPIYRGKDRVLAADHHVSIRVPGKLRELARRRFDQ